MEFSLGSALRSTGNPKVPLVATMSSFVANAFFNYIFIFGKLGLPAMGVVGAALGTVVARLIEIWRVSVCHQAISRSTSNSDSTFAKDSERILDGLLEDNFTSDCQ